MVTVALVLGLTARVWGYGVAVFFLSAGFLNILSSIYFQRAGIYVRLLSGFSLTWWFRWPLVFLEQAREYGWPRWIAFAYWISLIGFVVCGYFLVQSAPHR
jgi:hypothetical protein